MKATHWIACFATLCAISSNAFGENHYIRSGAAGNNSGSDWTNAWTDLPESFDRGDTYYIADGSYGAHTFNTPSSGSAYITIKKATSGDHGTNTGWSSTYGDGQAVFSGDPSGTAGLLTFSSDYWLFDGVLRNESDWADSTAYGFAARVTYGSRNGNKTITIANGADNITLQYIDMRQAGLRTNQNQDIFYCVSEADGGSRNIVVSRCYIHDVNRTNVFFWYASDWIVEYCNISRSDDNSTPHIHREPFSINEGGLNANGVIRYNIVKDIFDTSAPATGIVVIKDSVQGGYYIYGNVFDNVYTTNGLVTDTGGDTITNVVVYNNTFVNIHGLSPTASGITSSSGTTGNIARNNVWYNSDYAPTITNFSHDYNAAESSLGETHGVRLTSNPFTADYAPASGGLLDGKGDIGVSVIYRTDRNEVTHDEIGALGSGPAQPQSQPVIGSVTITPSSGYAKIGDSVSITVTETHGYEGLDASDALINGNYVSLHNAGSGTYTGTYTVREGDANGINVEAENITLTGIGGTSTVRSSTGSTLRIDAIRPDIATVTLSPSSGTVHVGDTVTITVTAANGETGLASATALFLGHQVPLTEQGGGAYTGTYTIQATDTAGGGSFAPDALLVDDFEDDDFDNWSYVSSGIFVAEQAKIASKAAAYTITSTDQNYMNFALGGIYDDLYTSFYIRLDPSFTMVDGNAMYVSMARSNDAYPWALRLRKSNGSYQMVVSYDAYVEDVGSWQTIAPGEWYWVKVHFRSAASGVLEWWLDSVKRGAYTGDTSGRAVDKIYSVALDSIDPGTGGSIYWDYFQVAPTDHTEPSVVEATAITLRDYAGNVSTAVSTSGSSLVIDTSQAAAPPVVESVTIFPNTGTVTAGDIVEIMVVAADNESGLTVSGAMINGVSVSLSEMEPGVYAGIYTVELDHNEIIGAECVNVILTDGDGNTSAAASSTGSTLWICPQPVGVEEPVAFDPELSRNFPNPFNSHTTIEYQVPASGSSHAGQSVNIVIYNISGQQVRTLVSDIREPGIYHAVWDGRDNSGSEVAAGLYLFKFTVGSSAVIKKMMFLK